MRGLVFVLLLLSLAGTATASITSNLSPNPKLTLPPYVNPPERITGDTVGDPFFIPWIPATVTGTTAGFTNDYEETCPFDESFSPDVVYAYVADGAISAINVDLCYSSYDTKLYIYLDAVTPGNPYACNDDYYTGPPCYTYSSFLSSVPVSAGHTYYIVIDGYSNDSGAYQMDVTDEIIPPPQGACCALSGACTVSSEVQCPGAWQGGGTACVPNPCPPPPQVECPPGALLEVEDNGGCGSPGVDFQPLNPQAGGCATMCGTSWASTSSRDTDWFVSIGTGALMTGTAIAEFPLLYILIYGTDCAAPSYILDTGEPGVPVTLSYVIDDRAEVWNWIGSSEFANWPESNYILDICGIQNPPPPPGACCRNGICLVMDSELCLFVGGTFIAPDVPCEPDPCQPVATERTSWGALKNLYR